jgi:enoyl-CoA hydratase/carnithine racemase
MSRPTKANALNLRMVDLLTRELEAAEADMTIRAIVLAGSGANFCAGADLAELLDGGAPWIRQMMDSLRTLLLKMERSRLAIVAAVQGAARAGGLEILLACDAVAAAESATFGDAHLANGLLPAGGDSVRLPRVVGWQRAKWLILSAEPIPAGTAVTWGIVTEVCADGDVLASAERLALLLARTDPETFAQAKWLLATLPELTFTEALEAEITTLEAHAKTAGFRSGISTFLGRGN